jgi:glycosyltransferase involved in cell wall biosynthesis
MRLIAISALADTAGAEVMLLRLLPELQRRGWSTRLTVPGGGDLRRDADAAGIATARLPLGPPARRTAGSYVGAALAPALARRADVVLLNGLSTQRVLRTLAPIRRRALLHVTNPLERPPRAWRRRGHWELVRVVLCDSSFSARQCIAAGAPPERVHAVWPPAWGVGWERPGPREPGASMRVGFVGRLEPRKGVLELVRAADSFLREHPDARLTVVGAPSAGGERYEKELRRAVASSDVGGRIELAGHRPDAASAMADFDLLAVPSLAEPFGTVAAEAAAAGVPVVASDVGGLPEVVLDGETGLLVPPGDVGALAAAVTGLLGDRDRLLALGRRAHEEAERFGPERYADRVEALLREAAA